MHIHVQGIAGEANDGREVALTFDAKSPRVLLQTVQGTHSCWLTPENFPTRQARQR